MFHSFPRAARTGLATLTALTALSAAASAQVSDRLVLHGYLTQGYAASDSIPVYGIPKDATGDYRTAVLQVRYALDDKSNLVLQMAHRRLGSSPLSGYDGNFVMDWAFFQSQVSSVRYRIGKIPLPMGIFGETRDVGTLIPFYRAPASFYFEGFRGLDGADLAHTFELPKSFSLAASVYGGGADGRTATQIPTGSIVTKSRFERIHGVQGWLSTPVNGLRFGVTAMRLRGVDTAWKAGAVKPSWYSSLVWSADGNFDRFVARAEYRELYIGKAARQYAYYGQTGVKLTPKIGIYAQADFSDQSAKLPTQWLRSEVSGDRGASVNYAISPSSVLKYEWHHIDGKPFDRYFAATMPAQTSNYSILSVSVAF